VFIQVQKQRNLERSTARTNPTESPQRVCRAQPTKAIETSQFVRFVK